MGARGPKPSDKPGKTVFAHVAGDVYDGLEDAVYTRDRKRSFLAAEAIRLGLPHVLKLYPAVRASKRRPAKAKKAAATGGNGASASKKVGARAAGAKTVRAARGARAKT